MIVLSFSCYRYFEILCLHAVESVFFANKNDFYKHLRKVSISQWFYNAIFFLRPPSHSYIAPSWTFLRRHGNTQAWKRLDKQRHSVSILIGKSMDTWPAASQPGSVRMRWTQRRGITRSSGIIRTFIDKVSWGGWTVLCFILQGTLKRNEFMRREQRKKNGMVWILS